MATKWGQNGDKMGSKWRQNGNKNGDKMAIKMAIKWR